ncbi:MAG: hypothetical protein LUG57_06580, partial [Oscillospiraceae bacterium]|nr:hypothetical protein [Oscillospiraceae bacterium]
YKETAFMLAPPDPLKESEIIEYNRRWNRYDPLYTDPDYARAHGHPSCPAMPGFKAMFPFGLPQFPKNIASKFFYTMDRNDIVYERNVYAGDILGRGQESLFMNELTVPGEIARVWEMGGQGETVDAQGNRLFVCRGNTLEAYSKYTDGTPPMDFSENMAEWTKYFPEAHVTTDEDYERIRAMWGQEKVMGDDTPYWEDVKEGDFLPITCSDGPITYMHMMYWYPLGDMSIYTREELFDPQVRATTFRDRFGGFLDETALHFSGRNIPGMRGVSYNETAARLVVRTLTNFVGTKGRVSRFGWGLYPFFKELRVRPIDKEMFDKVPGYEGRACERHGSEGDTVIGRACITGKGVNEKGEHTCDVALWAETLDGEIIQTCPSQIVLPSKAE